MTATTALIALVGYVVLLLWGMRMVQSGVERAFGSDLRHVLGRALQNRFVAVLAGLGVTVVLQSSTATAMMTTAFAARGIVSLVPALAVMLGANVGTAIIVKVLSFDVSAVAPILLIAGYIAFKQRRKGRVHDLGRVGIGLGLMLLALHLLVITVEPVSTAPALRELLSALTADPVLDLVFAAVLTFAAHSSVAVMLLLVSLATTHVVTPSAAVALALGANLGGALPPVLETTAANPANRRVPVGNLAVRGIGCLVVLPFVTRVAKALWDYDSSAAAAIANFHLAFNATLAILFIGLLDPLAAALKRLFPERVKVSDPARPAYLDEEALETPYLALSNAAREILHMGDIVEVMLGRLKDALAGKDPNAIDDAAKMGKGLDQLHEAIKAYIARLETEKLTERDAVRLSDLLEFAINLGHAGDVLERGLLQTAARLVATGVTLTPAERDMLERFYQRVTDDLRLALSTMLTEDIRSARRLLDAKRDLNDLERSATREHMARLGPAVDDQLAGTLYLTVLRDLRRINSHLASIGYAIIDSSTSRRTDELEHLSSQ
jgi:phosphate:Na+ symporter